MAIEVIKIPAQGKEDKVYEIRGKRVMIDRDLAECFGVETRVLNQNVKRNEHLFDEENLYALAEDWHHVHSDWFRIEFVWDSLCSISQTYIDRIMA